MKKQSLSGSPAPARSPLFDPLPTDRGAAMVITNSCSRSMASDRPLVFTQRDAQHPRSVGTGDLARNREGINPAEL